MKQLLAITALAFVIASCNTNYEKTPSGLAYKIFSGGGKEKLKQGDIIKMNLRMKITGKDTVFFDTYGKMPEYFPVDTSRGRTHDFSEILKYLSVGDSAEVVSQVDTLVKMQQVQYNETFKKGDQVVGYLKILKVFKNDQERMADLQAEIEKAKKNEIAELESYLKKKGINTQKTPGGVFVEVKAQGGDPKAIEGKQVTVDYTGSLLTSGKKFDSNVDPSFGHVQPFSFVLGQGQTIPGWEEGLKIFGKGGKGTLYVPSMMAYGPRGSAPVIPPYSNLKFDIDLRDITDAPVQKPMPQMQGQGQGQGDPSQQGQQGQNPQQQPQQQQNPH